MPVSFPCVAWGTNSPSLVCSLRGCRERNAVGRGILMKRRAMSSMEPTSPFKAPASPTAHKHS